LFMENEEKEEDLLSQALNFGNIDFVVKKFF
jgi:hypothetical protein